VNSVQDRLNLALEWIGRHQPLFSYRLGQSPRDQLMLLKPFAELLLVQTVLVRNQGTRLSQRTCCEWAWQESDRGEHLLALLQARPDLIELVTIAGSFSQLGYHNDALDRWLRILFDPRALPDGELPAWRRAALFYHLAQLDLCPPFRALDKDAWLARRPDPWIISEERLYALTHHVFYVTDFGVQPAALDDDVRCYLELWLPVWADRTSIEGNWDLFGELTLTALCVRLESSGQLLQQLLSVQDPDGSFVGVPNPISTLQQFSIHRDEAFYANYHPTLVGTLALVTHQIVCDDPSPDVRPVKGLVSAALPVDGIRLTRDRS